MKLNVSPVVFDAALHTYRFHGVQLRGVTKMIREQLFPDEYANVPDGILAAAADRGTAIHSECEIYDTIGAEPYSEEGKGYAQLCEEKNFVHVTSEYLVSDNKHFASMIDKVYKGDEDGEFDLADIKTTYTLNVEYVRWQLSIYAYMFELQNPQAKVRKLIALWLRKDKAEAVEVKRIDAASVKALMAAELAGEKFVNSIRPMGEAQLPDKLKTIVDRMKDICASRKRLEHDEALIKDALMKVMTENGITKFVGEGITITRVADAEVEKFDAKAFKAADPTAYALYTKKILRKGYVTFKNNN